MNSKLLLDVFSGKETKVPFWFMRQAGRYLPEYREVRKNFPSFLEFCYSPKDAAEVTLQPLRQFPLSAAIIFSDILVIPHALGRDVTFVEHEGPKLTPLEPGNSLPKMSSDQFREFLSPVYEAIARVKEQLSKEKTLIGFAGAPFTLACYIIEGGGSRDFAKTRNFYCKHPDQFSSLIGLLSECVVFHLSEQIKAGAEAVQLFDSWAGILPAQDFSEYVIQPAKKITAALKKLHPSTPILGFPRGAGEKYKSYAEESGVDGVSLDERVNPLWAIEHLPKHVVLQGNLDPYLLSADLDKTLDRAKKLKAHFEGRRYIFNLGHGVLQHTPVEHVAKLSEMLAA